MVRWHKTLCRSPRDQSSNLSPTGLFTFSLQVKFTLFLSLSFGTFFSLSQNLLRIQFKILRNKTLTQEGQGQRSLQQTEPGEAKLVGVPLIFVFCFEFRSIYFDDDLIGLNPYLVVRISSLSHRLTGSM